MVNRDVHVLHRVVLDVVHHRISLEQLCLELMLKALEAIIDHTVEYLDLT